MGVDDHSSLLARLVAPKFAAPMRLTSGATLLALALFVTFTALRAIGEAWANADFPELLAVKLENLPLIFPVHMVTGGLALLLVPLAIFFRHTPWHKWAGRLAAADVLLAGVTAIPVATFQPMTFWSGLGFSLQASVWLVLLGTGYMSIRRGNVKAHQTAMLLMAAVTSGALFFRLYLGLWARFGWPQLLATFYAMDSFVAWGLPLVITALLLRKNISFR